MAEDYETDLLDSNLDNYANYEEYLDAQRTDEDLFYLEDTELVRQLYEVGCHGKTELLTRQQFEERKQAAVKARKNQQQAQVKTLTHTSYPLNGNPFLEALAVREEGLRNGRLTTILFIRDERNKRQVSAYIDLADRMKTEDFKLIFQKRKNIVPRPSDLSYYSWEGQQIVYNDSPNFRVDVNSEAGLLFRNRRDRKVINVNPYLPPEEQNGVCTRTEIECEEYTQVVFFDHETRRKN